MNTGKKGDKKVVKKVVKNNEVKKVVKNNEVKKVAKKVDNRPKFITEPIKYISTMKMGGKRLYSTMVKVINATKTDIDGEVEKWRKKLAEKYPNAEMNISLKYKSKSHPISAGFQNVKGVVKVMDGYPEDEDEEEERNDDPIEFFYISMKLD